MLSAKFEKVDRYQKLTLDVAVTPFSVGLINHRSLVLAPPCVYVAYAIRLPASGSGGASFVPLIHPGSGARPTHVFDQPRPPASCHFCHPAGADCPGVSGQSSNDSNRYPSPDESPG